MRLGNVSLVLAWVGLLLSAPGTGHASGTRFLAGTWISPLATFSLRPLAGLVASPADTPEVEALWVGEVEGLGAASLNVIFFPGLTAEGAGDPAALARIQAEVVASLERAEPLSARSLPADHPSGRGFEMELSVWHQLEQGPRAMYMLQRQVEAPDGVYNLTAYCLAEAKDKLRPAFLASFDSFRVMDETSRATPEELVLDAGFRFSRGELGDAERLASRVKGDAPFRDRVAALRIRLACLVAMGRLEEAYALARSLVELWLRDDRPFSAHYAWLLQRGLGDFRRGLDRATGAEVVPEARAALAGLALDAWALPASLVPPRISELQDKFLAALRRANLRHLRDDEANTKAVLPSLEAAAKEVEDFLVRYEALAATGAAAPGPGDENMSWLSTSLWIPLTAAVRARDRARLSGILERWSRILGRASGGKGFDPAKALAGRTEALLGLAGSPVREIAYRIGTAASEVLEQEARRVLAAKGLPGLAELAVGAGPGP